MICFQLTEPQVLTDPVKDNDRVINGITDDGQNGNNEGQIDFEAEYGEDRDNQESVM
ncbi:hypothetical protein D3C76_1703770 [compost metagenome]